MSFYYRGRIPVRGNLISIQEITNLKHSGYDSNWSEPSYDNGRKLLYIQRSDTREALSPCNLIDPISILYLSNYRSDWFGLNWIGNVNLAVSSRAIPLFILSGSRHGFGHSVLYLDV